MNNVLDISNLAATQSCRLMITCIGRRAVGVPVKYAELKAFQSPFSSHVSGPITVSTEFAFSIWRSQPDRQTDSGPPAKIAGGVGGPNECAAWVLFFRFDGSTMGLFAGT